MLTALVIDDKHFAREELAELLEETGYATVIGEAPNAIIGLKKINELKPVFVDIQMPQVTGIELLSMLDPETMPYVVFVTAYDHYAIQAFEENAFDYLLKPVNPSRLTKTVSRLHKVIQQSTPQQAISAIAPNKLDQIPCIGHNRIVILTTDTVECAYSDISGVQVRSNNQTASTQLTLKTLEEKTPLVRCHRQYLVNIKMINEIKLLENGLAEIITKTGYELPVSRRYLSVLKKLLGIF
ncbi:MULTISPECIES: two-component system response regulator BtsR [unclassified Photobacterium]|uniref:two-component system response regulator BtsR n=1 Tax=unclassified Photobacterium TaxID=2628852 RepID=UPI001EE03863|nr:MULTISPECIES: two-component system response regulator BtsR [unclassified Photobacterium]MCG3866299.1 two-component system response regulator BtsR [Photobacterium sp. Ph6]MCG3877827.1 two-component system response regulator BtsR [Photobacterium sp. Ph5]